MRIIAAAPLLLALLVLGACSGGPAPAPLAQVAPPSRQLAQGIDLAIDTGDHLNQIRAGRLNFVARYYRDPSSHWPPLTPAEAQRLSATGVKIVAVFESHSANPAYFSYARGYWDAVTAVQEARAVGQPTGSAIYFGVDFNARVDQVPAVEDYFRGVAAALAAAGGGIGRAPYKVGVYGSGAVCGLLKFHGLAQYAWLSNSTAWAGARTYQDWNIRQGTRFAALSFDHDADEAVGDYGGFEVGGPATPQPLLAAVTVPPAVAAAVVTAVAAAVAPPPAGAAAVPSPIAAPPVPAVAVGGTVPAATLTAAASATPATVVAVAHGAPAATPAPPAIPAGDRPWMIAGVESWLHRWGL